MRIIVIGAVAAGTSAAAKARRNSEDAEIVIYEKDRDISYSGCGMPYYLGGEVTSTELLTPRDPAYFLSKYQVEVKIGHEVLTLDPKEKKVTVKNLDTGETFDDHYDKLILATGARSSLPPIPGADQGHVFSLRSIADMRRIKSFLDAHKPGTAAIIGTGFIGLELCENFKRIGMEVTMIEKLDQVTPGLDPDMALLVSDYLTQKGVTVITGASVEEIKADHVNITKEGQQKTIPGDLVIVAAGVRPATELARQAGLVLGETGAIQVDGRMVTSDPNIYACGDCIQQFHVVTGKPVFRPLGSTANKTGRIAGDQATGGTLEFRGVLGTGIFRVFDLTVAQTGLSQREAEKESYQVTVSHNIKPDRPDYLGGKEMTIKAIADAKDGRLLGVQIVGEAGVDKRIDVFATAITFGARADDLFHLDLAYSPPYSTTKDAVHYTGMILENALHKGRPLMTVEELEERMAAGEKVQLVDARVPEQFAQSGIPGAINLPQEELRKGCQCLDPDALTVTYCNKGVTGNAAQNILLNKGFKKVYNLSGGNRTYQVCGRGKK